MSGHGFTRQRRFETLDEALRAQRIPFENHAMIHRIVVYIPVGRYEESGAHVRAIRRDGGHDLLIKSGYTTGFSSWEEGAAASGGQCEPNSKTGVNWLVVHPVNSLRDGNGARGGSGDARPRATCPTCGDALPLSGVCDFC